MTTTHQVSSFARRGAFGSKLAARAFTARPRVAVMVVARTVSIEDGFAMDWACHVGLHSHKLACMMVCMQLFITHSYASCPSLTYAVASPDEARGAPGG